MIQVMSTFEHNIKLELAISALEFVGIEKQNIFAVPLTNRKVERRLFDNLHNSDGISLSNTGAALATAFSVVGASIGFSLKWGPIYWGLIGAGSGFLLGFLLNFFFYKVVKKRNHVLKGKNPQVILIVECDDQQADSVEDILWHHLALGVARVEI